MPTGPAKSGPPKPEASSSQAVKLPEFMPSAPLVWWLSCESAFEVRNIICTIQKYHYLVAALPSDVTTKLLHVLQAGPRAGTQEEDPRYGMLKTAIIQLFAPSEFDAFMQYLDVAPLQPSQKPSELLAIIRAGLPPTIDDGNGATWFIKMRLLTLLPMSMRTMCLGREFLSLEDLAAYADTIMSRSTPSLPLSAAALVESETCAAVVHRKKKQPIPPPTPPPSPTTTTQDGLCWFHRRWGEEAKKCNRRGCKMTRLVPGTAQGNDARDRW